MSTHERDPNKAKRPHTPNDDQVPGQTSARPEAENELGEQGAMPSTENTGGGDGGGN